MTTPEPIPTRWPDWVAITTDNTPLPDPPADADPAWRVLYAGECLYCHATTTGARDAVVVWAQDHFACEPPPGTPAAPPAPIPPVTEES